MQNPSLYIKIAAILTAVLMVATFVLFVFKLITPLTFWLFTALFGFVAFKAIPYLKDKYKA